MFNRPQWVMRIWHQNLAQHFASPIFYMRDLSKGTLKKEGETILILSTHAHIRELASFLLDFFVSQASSGWVVLLLGPLRRLSLIARSKKKWMRGGGPLVPCSLGSFSLHSLLAYVHLPAGRV